MANFPKIFLLLAGTMLLLSPSCRKKGDTIVKIYVRGADNGLLAGASVRLFATPGTIDKTTTTNSSGEAIFNFNDVYQLGQAGVAVLDIEASKGGSTGEGIIKVEEETTSEGTVFIQP